LNSFKRSGKAGSHLFNGDGSERDRFGECHSTSHDRWLRQLSRYDWETCASKPVNDACGKIARAFDNNQCIPDGTHF
jgi:hypothetical protein